jgi:hypothetical protein
MLSFEVPTFYGLALPFQQPTGHQATGHTVNQEEYSRHRQGTKSERNKKIVGETLVNNYQPQANLKRDMNMSSLGQ